MSSTPRRIAARGFRSGRRRSRGRRRTWRTPRGRAPCLPRSGRFAALLVVHEQGVLHGGAPFLSFVDAFIRNDDWGDPGSTTMQSMSRTFEDLVAEADSVSVDGWDFAWLDGRATEERPSWGYQRLLSSRLATVSAALDIHTGGGEVLSGAGPFPPTMAAIETWPPNAALATKRLHPLGVVLVATRDEPPLPFAEE